MDDLITQLLGFLRGTWTCCLPCLVRAWVMALGGVVFMFRVPSQFEASTHPARKEQITAPLAELDRRIKARA